MCLDLWFQIDIYVVISNFSFPGPPTQAKAYKALLAAEMEAELSGSGAIGAAHFVNNGLRLERDQCVFPQYCHVLSFDIGYQA